MWTGPAQLTVLLWNYRAGKANSTPTRRQYPSRSRAGKKKAQLSLQLQVIRFLTTIGVTIIIIVVANCWRLIASYIIKLLATYRINFSAINNNYTHLIARSTSCAFSAFPAICTNITNLINKITLTAALMKWWKFSVLFAKTSQGTNAGKYCNNPQKKCMLHLSF